MSVFQTEKKQWRKNSFRNIFCSEKLTRELIKEEADDTRAMMPLHGLEMTSWPAPIHTSVGKKILKCKWEDTSVHFFPHRKTPHGHITIPIYEESEIT